MKKQIEKQIEKTVKMIERIEEYNSFLNDNRYYERGCNAQLSFNVKMYNLSINTDEVEKHIDTLGITGERREQIIEEFNEGRLEGIYSHFLENQGTCFIEDVEQKESPYYNFFNAKDIGFYGRSGGHLCLGDISSFELEIGDTEVNNYPIWDWSREAGSYWSFNKDISVLIEEFKQSFGVTTQREVYNQLKEDATKGDLKSYYDAAIKNQATIEMLETDISEFKKNANKYLLEELHYEIDNFIENEYGIEIAIEKAETGDYSQIDTIKEVTETDVLTNRNAKVPVLKAKTMLAAIIQGVDVIGQKIGGFTINKIEKREHDIYIKIGCHLFSLNKTRLTLTA